MIKMCDEKKNKNERISLDNKEKSIKMCDEKCHDKECEGECCHTDCCHDEQCACSHEHHEHDHHKHDERTECGCGCAHEHHENEDHDDCGCGCGCGHDHDGEDKKQGSLMMALKYVLGAIPIVVAFLPILPLPLRIAAAVVGYLIFGYEVVGEMIRSFRRKRIFTEFTLMFVASMGAFAIGEFADAAAVVYLYSLGEALSDRAYSKSRARISDLLKITPEYARVVRNGDTVMVSPNEVQVGDELLLITGDRIPVDGVITEGGADADTSSVTGESMPLALYKDVGCPSGAVILNGSAKMRAVSVYEDSVVARLTKAVEEAGKRRSIAEKKISKFARLFTPIAFLVATLITVAGTIATRDFVTWLRMGLVVLVVSCPCSLVLSVPLTYFAGMGAAASKGIIFKGGEVMESLREVRAVAFDKTGTITESELEFSDFALFSDVDAEEFLSLAKSVLSNSPHAAAVSFCRSCDRDGRYMVSNVENIGGRGIVCEIEGKQVLFGNGALMRENGINVEDSKTTAIFGASDGKLLGRLDFSSKIKAHAAITVKALKDQGIDRIAVISGDGKEAVSSVCEAVGIEELYYSVSPDEKAKIFDEISADVKSNKKGARTAYCGDGLNDSAVIASADVGIAMGKCGAALTVDSADIVLTDDDIGKLADAITVAKRTSRIATQNIIISIGIKVAVLVIGVVLSAALNTKIPMELALVADVGAALVAVANSLRAAKRRTE